jgi:hypothetical protein
MEFRHADVCPDLVLPLNKAASGLKTAGDKHSEKSAFPILVIFLSCRGKTYEPELAPKVV